MARCYATGTYSDRLPVAHMYYRGMLPTHYGTSLPVYNPATGKVIGLCPVFDHSTAITDIFRCANQAQQYWYHEIGTQEKQNIFLKAAELFEKNRGELVWTMIREGGKLWKWADAEVTELIETVMDYHGEIQRVYASQGVSRCRMSQKVVKSYRKPKGVVLCIAPWNFPLNIIIGWKAVAALAGGNAVILKPAEQTPHSASFGVSILLEAMDRVLGNRFSYVKNIIQLIHGSGHITGNLLVSSGLYDMIAFTGGEETGRVVASEAARHLKQAHLELGGHAAMVILSDFDISRAMREAVRGVNGDSGQRCVSTRAVWVPEKKYQEALALYTELVKNLRIGAPDDFTTEMGPLVSEEQLRRVDEMVKMTVQQGGKCILGGYPLNIETLARAKNEGFNINDTAIAQGGYYYAPTILTQTDYGMVSMKDEIFGPVVNFLPLYEQTLRGQFEEGVTHINQARQGLSNAILTDNAVLLEEAPFRIKTGILYGRRTTIGAESGQAFPATKDSGWGWEGKGIEPFTDLMTYYVDLADAPRMAQEGEEETVKELLRKSKSPYFE